ncbi:site-specific DNA-methyltransferase [Vibrio lentus]|uniref:site-specific DNA-methyltransferase n=1 Tax=Vibrio lentus TaxID=136468 RepID=UPI0009FA6321|nr:site-specific DNA-methyltransferase [Vibrio lentus]
MNIKQKLELTWIGKSKKIRLEPRILLEDKSLSYTNNKLTNENAQNLLIKGDNLLSLKSLEHEFSNKVKCVYIDPPYNTGSAFDEYEDGLEHSMWLSLLKERLVLIHEMLSEDGSLWVSIDDHECHYLKVLLDEIFGRKNFVSTICWQKKYAAKADSKYLSESHDFILCYAKNLSKLSLNRLEKGEKQNSRYKNPDDDPRGPWKAGDTLRNEVRDYAVFPVFGPKGEEHWPSDGTSWRYTKDKFEELIKDNRVWFGKNGTARPAIKRFLSEVTSTMPSTTWWSYQEVGHNDEAKKESKALFGKGVFSTPKPERLIERILTLATNPGDLVLDSFAGSGTTGAVAQKMGRRWIMVELGDHCEASIVPRLKKVIDGEDQGGISKAVNWQGGGGFRYLRLAPSLLQKDEWGNWIINKEYNAEMLAAAVCKHMGFTYAPNDTQFWNQGYSTETDFIYVTTGALAYDQLKRISEEVGEERTLLICCKAFMSEGAEFPNLTIKKIPQAILNKCEWDNDDYSFTLDVLAEDNVEQYDEEEE